MFPKTDNSPRSAPGSRLRCSVFAVAAISGSGCTADGGKSRPDQSAVFTGTATIVVDGWGDDTEIFGLAAWDLSPLDFVPAPGECETQEIEHRFFGSVWCQPTNPPTSKWTARVAE